ncbi:MAG TPA: hypothetical protein VIW29_19695 [Polyangiaceae bacterium]
MSLLRSLSASLLSAASSFAVVTATGCDTGAVGVEDCRQIESARCKASESCGLLEDDVDACERYYRDHCRHGVAGNDPAGSQVSECVKVIEAAGKCAASKTDVAPADKKDIELSACDEKVTEPQPPDLTTVCMVVERPELAAECAFLLPPDVVPPDGEGGTGNTEPEPEPTGGTGSGGQATGGTPAE